MKTSTARFLGLHLISDGLFFVSIMLAEPSGVRTAYYLPAVAFAVVAIGTLKDFVRFYNEDHQRRGTVPARSKRP